MESDDWHTDMHEIVKQISRMNEAIGNLQAETSGISANLSSTIGMLRKDFQEKGQKTEKLCQGLVADINNQEERINSLHQQIKVEHDEIKKLLQESHRSLVKTALHFNKAIEVIHNDMSQILGNMKNAEQTGGKNDINNVLKSMEKKNNYTNRSIVNIPTEMVKSFKELDSRLEKDKGNSGNKERVARVEHMNQSLIEKQQSKRLLNEDLENLSELSSKIKKELEKLNNAVKEIKSQRREETLKKDIMAEQSVPSKRETKNPLSLPQKIMQSSLQPNKTTNMNTHVFNPFKEVLKNHQIQGHQLLNNSLKVNSQKRPEAFLNGVNLQSLQQMNLKNAKVSECSTTTFNPLLPSTKKKSAD